MKIYLIRHTKVATEGYCYGQTDVPLYSTFEEEANIVKTNITPIAHDIVFSSPLSRCVKLANYCGYHHPDLVLNNNIKELNMGDWEMQKWDDLKMEEWKTDWVNAPAPNGESLSQMYKRVSSFFNDLKNTNYSSVKIFAHAGVISCAKAYFGESDLKNAFEKTVSYGEIVNFNL